MTSLASDPVQVTHEANGLRFSWSNAPSLLEWIGLAISFAIGAFPLLAILAPRHPHSPPTGEMALVLSPLLIVPAITAWLVFRRDGLVLTRDAMIIESAFGPFRWNRRILLDASAEFRILVSHSKGPSAPGSSMLEYETRSGRGTIVFAHVEPEEVFQAIRLYRPDLVPRAYRPFDREDPRYVRQKD